MNEGWAVDKDKQLEGQADAGPADDLPKLTREGAVVVQYLCCNRDTCSCTRGGRLHGPYFLRFVRQDGKLAVERMTRDQVGEALVRNLIKRLERVRPHQGRRIHKEVAKGRKP